MILRISFVNSAYCKDYEVDQMQTEGGLLRLELMDGCIKWFPLINITGIEEN